jgi:hypothetical protein
MFFGDLPYHRKHGSRMLDALLVAAMEWTRSFTLGVVPQRRADAAEKSRSFRRSGGRPRDLTD